MSIFYLTERGLASFAFSCKVFQIQQGNQKKIALIYSLDANQLTYEHKST